LILFAHSILYMLTFDAKCYFLESVKYLSMLPKNTMNSTYEHYFMNQNELFNDLII
jgi:hypothetical protein